MDYEERKELVEDNFLTPEIIDAECKRLGLQSLKEIELQIEEILKLAT